MPCQNCNNSTPSQVYLLQTTYPSKCLLNECGGSLLSSKCVYYSGPNLVCSGVNSNDSLELALQKIDEQICQVTADYSTYNTYCLAPIETQQEFVETISDYVCTTRTMLTDFTSETFVEYQTEVDERFVTIEQPEITCSFAGVTSFDAVQTVLTKYCTAFNTLNTAISLSGVDWSQCFTVTPAPTTISQAFSVVIDLICQVNSNGTTLPTFNNVGTCLPTPGASDSLVNTIEKIKTRLCQTGTFDANTLTWGCSTAETNLQDTIQLLLNGLTDWKQNKPTYSEDFVVTQVDEEDPCQGVLISLASPISGTDRLVATSATDDTPGTLIQKLTVGSKLSLTEIGSNPSKQLQLTTTAIDVVTTSNSASVNFTGNGTSGSPLSATVVFPAASGNLQQVTDVGNSTTNNIVVLYNGGTSISSGENAASINCMITPSTSFGSVDFYGTASTLGLDLVSTPISGSTTFNRSGLYGAIVVSNNNGVKTSAPLQAIRGAIVLSNANLERISVLEARTPAMSGTNNITNLIGCYIEPLAQTGIINSYSIYQEGTGDTNFYAGKTKYASTITPIGTTGNVTINKPSGKVNFALADTSVVVTNSFVTEDSIVIPVIQTSSAANPYIKSCVVSNGSFTINLNTSPDSGTITVAFVVYN
jgi:hypothetical protein